MSASPLSSTRRRHLQIAMTRRQSECYRNLDDPLKVFSLLTMKSCGLVVLFYAGAVASDLLFGLCSLIFGDWSFLAQLAGAILFGAGLAFAERHDDEHLVPSAIRYYLSRRWRVLYGGARDANYTGHALEAVVRGGPWHG
jgi:hypothetical protein